MKRRFRLPYDDFPPIPTPDQSRYGRPRHLPFVMDGTKDVLQEAEAGGVMSTCLGCGWIAWEPNQREARLRVNKHKCTKSSRGKP